MNRLFPYLDSELSWNSTHHNTNRVWRYSFAGRECEICLPVKRTNSLALPCKLWLIIINWFHMKYYDWYKNKWFLMQDEFIGNYNIHDSFDQQSNYPHRSVLELIEVNYTYVGFYYCVKNISEVDASLRMLVKNSFASKIYLFVDGNVLILWMRVISFLIWYEYLKL